MTVNGRAVHAEVEPRTLLADFLREELLLTGTHLGCEHGVCGACTVHIDGAPARACIALAVTCEGAEVRTVEGFDDDPAMAALREAFTAHHALQCGYCTPGMLISARDIVTRLPQADEARIREELSGNLCRCTGYQGIVAAIRAVQAAPPAAPAAEAPGTPRERAVSWPRAAARAAPTARAGRLEEGRYRLEVPVAADALWPVLADVASVARCLPGAVIEGDPSARPVAFTLNVALGPMRVAFRGDAEVDHDPASRSGRARARGEDTRTRSRGEGTLAFGVEPVADDECALVVSMDYTLGGPLAQFSRGPLVDAVVAQMLERFAANAARLARGEGVREEEAVGGLGLTLRALLGRLLRRLRGDDR